jgi:hypothetical protein
MIWYPFKNVVETVRNRRNPQQWSNADPNYQPEYGAGTGGNEAMSRLQQQAMANQGMAGQFGGQQQSAYDMYAAQARGEGPSLAQEQLKQATSQNVANQQAMMAQGRGGNIAGMSRAAAAAGAGAQAAGNQQAAQLRAQEQLAAMGGMADMANTQAQMNMQQQLAYEQMLQQSQMAQMDASQQQNQFQLQRDFAQQQANRDFGLGIADRFIGGGMGAAQTAAMFSDERVKTNAQPGGLQASQAVGSLTPTTYQYKSPEYGPAGTRIGVMAQDLERSPAGAQLVQNTPAGKTVDVAGGMSLALAASADQEKRLRMLERGYMLQQQGGQMASAPTAPSAMQLWQQQQMGGAGAPSPGMFAPGSASPMAAGPMQPQEYGQFAPYWNVPQPR